MLQKQGISSSSFRVSELNSVWRNILSMGIMQKIPKSFKWENIEESNTFSFLEKGCVRLDCVSSSGRQRIVLQIESGCLFREIGMFHTSYTYSTMHIAMEDCILYNFPKSLLFDMDFIRNYPELLINMVTSLGYKGGAFFSQLVETTEIVPDEVICRFIESLAEKNGANCFNPHMTQVELALNLGMHRSTVCRVLKDLRNEGILGSFTCRKLEILDRTRLQARCE